jgi:hypothetical protein
MNRELYHYNIPKLEVCRTAFSDRSPKLTTNCSKLHETVSYKIGGFHMGVIKDSRFPGCDAVSTSSGIRCYVTMLVFHNTLQECGVFISNS